MSTRAATALAHEAHLGLREVPWTVRAHSEPQGRQHPWLWACDQPGCNRGGPGVNAIDAHHAAATHHLKQHN